LNPFFGELYLRSTRPFLSPERTAKEVAYLARALAGAPRGPVLDVGCGHGRHAAALAARGVRVVGIDQDPASLAQCDPGFPVVRGDFREPPFRAGFGGAFAWYSTLFTEDDAANVRALHAVAGCLARGGLLMVQTVPRSWLADHPKASYRGELPDGSVLEEDSAFDPSTGCDTGHRRLTNRDGRILTGSYSIRYYETDELRALAEGCGLTLAWAHGDLGGGPVEPSSSEIIVGFSRLA
jgi:SAM-dependent methyltransferase